MALLCTCTARRHHQAVLNKLVPKMYAVITGGKKRLEWQCKKKKKVAGIHSSNLLLLLLHSLPLVFNAI